MDCEEFLNLENILLLPGKWEQNQQNLRFLVCHLCLRRRKLKIFKSGKSILSVENLSKSKSNIINPDKIFLSENTF